MFDDAGNIFRPVAQKADDSGRFLVTNVNGIVGYLDNGHQFVPNALPKLPDFQHGRISGQYDTINTGPLDDSLAGTFSGGRYTEIVLESDVELNRAGTADVPLGQFFTQTSPDSVLKTRIDSAILPEWPGGGKSPLDTSFEIKIPAGTKVYVGEVSSQGGFYIGGTQQIVVPKPWLLDGVEIIGSKPLK